MHQRESHAALYLVVYGFLFIIAAGFGGYGILELAELDKARQSRRWQKTEGKITHSSVARVSRDGSLRSLSTPFRGGRPIGTRARVASTGRRLRLEYTYSINGKPYTGKRVRFGSFSPAAEKTVKRYPKGRSVTVYYDPEAPEESVLEQGISRSITMVLAVCGGIIVLCLLSGILFRIFMKRYTRSSVEEGADSVQKKIPHRQKQEATLTLFMGGVSLLLLPVPVLGWIVILFTMVYGVRKFDFAKENGYRAGKIQILTGAVLALLAAAIKLIAKKYL